LAPGELADPSLQVLGPVVDGHRRPVFAAQLELVVARGSRDDGRAHEGAELDRGETDTAGGAQHHKCLAGLQTPSVLQRVVRRAIGIEERRRGAEVDAVGDRDQGAGADCDLLGEPTPPGRSEDPIADRDAVDTRADRTHDAGDLGAGGEGERWLELVQVLDDEDVGEVHGARLDVYDHLAASRGRIVDVLHDERLGRSVLPADDCAHGGTVAIRC
jgi:hypothetical protein